MPDLRPDSPFSASLVGVSLAAVGPFHHAWCALPQGVTVFYGPNGAGKSTVLKFLSTTLLKNESDQEYEKSFDLDSRDGLSTGASAFSGVHARLHSEQMLERWTHEFRYDFHFGPDSRSEMSDAVRQSGLVGMNPSGWWPEVIPNELTLDLFTEWNAAQASWITDMADEPLWQLLADSHAIRFTFDRFFSEEVLAQRQEIVGREERIFASSATGQTFSEHEALAMPQAIWWYGIQSQPQAVQNSPFGKSLFDVVVVESAQSADTINRETAEYLSDTTRLWIPTIFDLTEEMVADYQATLLAVELSANHWLKVVLPHAPTISCLINSARDALAGRPVAWVLEEANGKEHIPVEAASPAVQRWIVFAVRRAMKSVKARSIPDGQERQATVVIIDEPELGLDDLAQFNLASNLATLADWVIVATHSPAVLRTQRNLVQVQRDASTGYAQLRAEDGSSYAGSYLLDEMERSARGLTGPGAVASTRLITMVEGVHEIAVLGALLQAELRSERSVMVPMMGTHDLGHLAASRLLFESTDVPVLVLLDKLPRTSCDLDAVWRDAKARSQSSVKAGLSALKPMWAETTPAAKHIGALMRAAVETGTTRRLHLHFHDKKDVVNYVPIGQIWPGCPYKSWSAAFSAFARDVPRSKQTGLAFKQFCNRAGAGYHEAGLQAWANALTEDDRLEIRRSEIGLTAIAAAIRQAATS